MLRSRVGQAARFEGFQRTAATLLESAADRGLTKPKAIEESRRHSAVVALREPQEERFLKAPVDLVRGFYLPVALKRTLTPGCGRSRGTSMGTRSC